MRITKFGHACVRIEHDGSTIVLDPGVFTDPEAVDGADAVLITREHPDHYLPANLARRDAPVYTDRRVGPAAKIREDAPVLAERYTVVAPGDTFEGAGLSVRAVGELHAVIRPEMPRIFDGGYVVTRGRHEDLPPRRLPRRSPARTSTSCYVGRRRPPGSRRPRRSSSPGP